jgi:hypothetical protein
VEDINAEVKAPRPLRAEAPAALIGGLLSLFFSLLVGVAMTQRRQEKIRQS